MPQVNAFNFQSTPQNLAAINGVRPDYMGMVWDWQQRAQQHDQTGLADLMRASQHEATMDPIRVQQGQATLADTQAGTAGKLLNNEEQRMKNEVAQHVLPQAKIQAFKDLILKGTEGDEKMAQIEIDKMLRSNDPKQRAYGTQLLNTSRKAIDEKRKEALAWEFKQKELAMTEGGANSRQAALFAHQKDLETMRTGRATAVAAISAAARKAKLDAGANPKKWQELAVSLAVSLRSEQDPEVKAMLQEELTFAQQMAERLTPAQAPVIDPTKVGDGKLKDPRGPIPQAPGAGPKLGTKENPIKLD
jgi:hypothetical protein